jgi:uncharacterized protein (TIGR02271 family)
MDMEPSSRIVLITRDGFQGWIDPESLPLGPAGTVSVRFENGERVSIPAALLKEQTDESYVLPMTLEEAKDLHLSHAPDRETLVIPVAEERLAWQKRTVETGRLRITKRVSTHVEEIADSLQQEAIEVERVAVNRPVDGPVPIRQEGDTLIVPVLEERIVVEKQLVLKEELHITKRRIESRQPRQVTLRREEVSVERIQPEAREVELESP